MTRIDPDDLIPVGTKVILDDHQFHDYETTITGHDLNDNRLPYWVGVVREDGDDRIIDWPASRDEIIRVAVPEPTKADKLKDLAKRTEALSSELGDLRRDISAQGYGGIATDLVTDAMGKLATVRRELSNAAGQAWVNEW